MQMNWTGLKDSNVKAHGLAQLFEMQVAASPNAIAISSPQNLSHSDTYAEVNARANQIAHFLGEMGIAPQTALLVYLKDTGSLAIAVLAALKAKCNVTVVSSHLADVPLEDLINRCRPLAILTESALAQLFLQIDRPIVQLDVDRVYWEGQLQSNLSHTDLPPMTINIARHDGEILSCPEPDLLLSIKQLQTRISLCSGFKFFINSTLPVEANMIPILWALLHGAELSPKDNIDISAYEKTMLTLDATLHSGGVLALALDPQSNSLYCVGNYTGEMDTDQEVVRNKPVLLTPKVRQGGMSAASFHSALPPELLQKVNESCHEQGCEPAIFWLAVWAIVLHRFSNEKSLALLVAGYKGSQLSIVQSICDNNRFCDFVRGLSIKSFASGSLGGDLHAQDYPASTVWSMPAAAAPGVELAFNKISQFLFNGDADQNKSQLQDQQLLHAQMLDLVVQYAFTSEAMQWRITYNQNVIETLTIENMALAVQVLAKHFCHYPHEKLLTAPLLNPQQLEMQIEGWNATSAKYEQDICIQELFEVQVERNPEAIAVFNQTRSLTYRQVNIYANKVAHLLRSLAADNKSSIGVILDRELEMPVAVLAVLKASAAYVPLDPEHPDSRIAFIMGDLAINTLICHYRYAGKISALKAIYPLLDSVIFIDPELSGKDLSIPGLTCYFYSDLNSQLATNPPVECRSSDRAYTIFTSGSTGKPKGVVVAHRPVINLIQWVNGQFNVNETDKLLFVTSLCFDLSVYDIFGALAAGASIRVASTEECKTANTLLGILLDESITFWNSAPANLQRIIPLIKNQVTRPAHLHLRLAFLSGDWIPVKLPDALRRVFLNVNVISLGGATEATVWSNYFPIKDVQPQWNSIPYGRPIQNARYYILNEAMQVCPVGVAGDLFIGGECLADGYTDAVLTRARFLPDPFVANATMYKTGDLARFEQDGTMIFLGRADFQVKVRGYRIELGEIEAAIQSHKDVDHAVVLVQDSDTQDAKIVAYIASNKHAITHLELRQYLANLLPDAMLPNFTFVTPCLPINSNGKVDRNALPWPLPKPIDPERKTESLVPNDSQASMYVTVDAKINHKQKEIASAKQAPPGLTPGKSLGRLDIAEITRKVQAMAEELVNNGEITSSANLFEVGATSLTMVFLAEKLVDEFHVEIPVDTFLMQPSIECIVEAIATGLSTRYPAKETVIASREPDCVDVSASELGDAPLTAEVSTRFGESDIAIIGTSMRFPGANSPDEFWKQLLRGEPSFLPLSADRKKLWDWLPEDMREENFIGAYLQDVDCFDNLFFHISPPEARSMDPQERVLLELSWACLEDAGYNPFRCNELLGKVGVYAGYMRDDYQGIGVDFWRSKQLTAFASNASGLSNRISYFLDLVGPSISINTSCASSMTAIHLAVEGLKRGECDAALVAGVNLLCHPYHQIMLRKLNFLSKNNASLPFSASADGWVLGEGAAVFLLKPLGQALLDRDPICAVIKHTEIGHMGKTTQYSAPNAQIQIDGIRRLLNRSHINPEDIDLIEACASGAPMGDAAEFGAFQKVFAAFPRAANEPYLIGTTKDYIGHLESASSMAQILKAMLQFKHGLVLPNLSTQPYSPLLGSQIGNLKIASRLSPLPCYSKHNHIALINTYGAGGATGHLLLASPPVAQPLPEIAPMQVLIPLSAQSDVQLRQQASHLHAWITDNHDAGIIDIAFTLSRGRNHFEKRLAFVVENTLQLKQHFQAYLAGDAKPGCVFGEALALSAAASLPVNKDISGRDLTATASDWVNGNLHLSAIADQLGLLGARVLRLPGYPFARVRHWLHVNPSTAIVGSENSDIPVTEKLIGRDKPEQLLAQPLQDDGDLQQQIGTMLVELLGEVTEVATDNIRLKDNTQNFGLNSLMIMSLNEKLAEKLGKNIPNTLFFECRTLAEVVSFLMKYHYQQVASYFRPLSAGNYGQRTAAASASTLATSKREPFEGVPAKECEIAIVGMAGRYPQANNIQQFWLNLREGIDSVTEIPGERWDVNDYLPENVPAPSGGLSRWGGFIDNVDKFDPLFFNIAPSTADAMDPQVRLFLETAWETLEDAGYSSHSLVDVYQGRIGVFVGVMHGDYQLHDGISDDGIYFMGAFSFGSIAHQVSYHLDLSGPSFALDTMCSASLTALHLAVASIHREECSAAIVGGVNVSIHPGKYIYQSMMTMHSSTGRCRSFASNGDGFIPGEGVGAIFIKPLADAQRDGDQVYGLVRGSYINSGGKTYGYTVPNPVAQAELIKKAMRNGAVDPLTVSYIEAHGTGTALGDPIEIRGLTQAFNETASDSEAFRKAGQYCAIGSAKSNIGHCESAAGMAGLTKVLLQMKFRQLVPSLHSEVLNPHIDFANSPFYVQQDLAPWVGPKHNVNGQSQTSPLIAGISSFGAGGANAHVIIEEYIDPNTAAPTSTSPVLIHLSAKSELQVEQLAFQLLETIDFYSYRDTDLNNIAYTLHVGRDEFLYRLALIVNSIAELQARLGEFLRDKSIIHNGWFGKKGHILDIPAKEKPVLTAHLAKGELPELARYWLAGHEIDWRGIYADAGYSSKRLSLPTYPFLKRSCWVAGKFHALEKTKASSVASTLHPLVHRNTSDLSRVCFSTRFTGDEFYLRDHVVNGQSILPGVAHLEMARVAASIATMDKSRDAVAVLTSVVWASPVIASKNDVDLDIELTQSGDKITYRLISCGENQQNQVLHSQGCVSFLPSVATPWIDIPALIGNSRKADIDKYQLYKQSADAGVAYGPAHQAVEEINTLVDSEESYQVLAKIQLPETVRPGRDSYVLHPSMLDAALQAAAALAAIAERGSKDIALPFALEKISVYSKCSEIAYVWVRKSKLSESSSGLRQYDIDIADAQGKVAVAIEKYTTRSIKPAKPMEKIEEVLLLQPRWLKQEYHNDLPATENPEPILHFIYFIGGLSSWFADVQTRLSVDHCYLINSEAKLLADRFTDYIKQMTAMLARHLHSAKARQIKIQVVLEGNITSAGAMVNGIAGLLNTLTREYSSVQSQLVVFDELPKADKLIAILVAEKQSRAREIYYARNIRQIRTLEEVLSTEVKSLTPAWRDRGVYLISGGMGAIGRMLVNHLCSFDLHLTIIILGRGVHDLGVQQLIDTCSKSGNKIIYQQVDISDGIRVEHDIQQLADCYGQFAGVFHCAGITRDSLLVNKSATQIVGVLAPKVHGLYNIDMATRNHKLDFFTAFSSISSIFGNPGQADYTAANGFMDGFMLQRAEMVADSLRSGNSSSINWPLWKNGGMQVDESLVAQMSAMGLGAMTDTLGMALLDSCASRQSGQYIVLPGRKEQLRKQLLSSAIKTDEPRALKQHTNNAAGNNLLAIQHKLLEVISAQLKIDILDLDIDTEFGEYGFDSITLTEFANRINARFSLAIMPTIFFEYSTVGQLSQYLLRNGTGASNLPVEAQLADRTPDDSLSFNPEPKPHKPAVNKSALEVSNIVLEKIFGLVSSLLKIDRADLDGDLELSEYGFDSINLTEFSNRLKQAFAVDVMPTVFFEYPTLRLFADYLVEQHRAAIVAAIPELSYTKASDEIAHSSSAARSAAGENAEVISAGKVQLDALHSHGTLAGAAVNKADSGCQQDAIAVIGMSGCFPQAKTITEFWQNLKNGLDCISEIPQERWDWREVYGDPVTDVNKTNVKWGGFIEGVGDFDPAFFNISPREALAMDPQQRLLLLHAWRAIEDSGHAPESLAGSNTAIFVGTTVSGYVSLMADADQAIEGYTATGISPSVGPNRLSFLLDLHGPSEPIETACSSSLIAIHRAVIALQLMHSDLAIAGGVNTILTPDIHIGFNKAGMLSLDGRCKTFSRHANGYSRGEGAGVIVLKRLSDAERDRDNIYAVILSTSQNHGGKANSLTAPNSKSQASLLKTAYKSAKIDPRTVTYIECHGTGTELGDPVEINGLKSAFAELYRDAEITFGANQYSLLGAAAQVALASVKSNIGHLEYAAGVAGVIKVLLQLQHKTLVRSLHCDELNPYIELADSPFYINSQEREWLALEDSSGKPVPRRAGVSSYGFGGVNAHIVMEEYSRPVRQPGKMPDSALIVLSAKTESQLVAQAERLSGYLASASDQALHDIAYTLQVGRNAMTYRFACEATSLALLLETLQDFISGERANGRWFAGNARADKSGLTAITADDDFDMLMTKWLEQKKYTRLLELWVSGFQFDWEQHGHHLYENYLPQRISLPTYAFDLKRYWVKRVAQNTAPAEVAIAPLTKEKSTAQKVVPIASSVKPQILLFDTNALPEINHFASGLLPIALDAGVVNIAKQDDIRVGRTLSAMPVLDKVVEKVSRTRFSVSEIQEKLRESLAEAIFIESKLIEHEIPFSELGLDSVTGVEWIREINLIFSLKIAASEIFNYPTIALFATYVQSLLETRVETITSSLPKKAETAEIQEPVVERARPSDARPQAPADREIKSYLVDSLKAALYLETERLDPELPFSELGLDSVTGVEWVNAINQQFTIKIATNELFNYPTLTQLTLFISQQLASRPLGKTKVDPIKAGENSIRLTQLEPVAQESSAANIQVSASDSNSPKMEDIKDEPIAVVGISCRYAGAESPDELWQNLKEGKDLVTLPLRWPEIAEVEQVIPIWGSFLDDIAVFDPMFFKISATEAKNMDPQQRIFLEECWKAIEDAGYAGALTGKQCGVYVGCGSGDYGQLLANAPAQAFWGNATSIIASRISYFMDLKGPAVAIDTACSSSLVAIHIACQALRAGEIDFALAGGVTVLSTPAMFVNAGGAGMLSATGRCHSFDARADGFVPGEGAGVVLLKRQSDALQQGDQIYGLIKGSAINQDGVTNGITAPSALAQESLERSVYQRYGVNAGDITMVEAHGTGTILGDPIEFQALTKAFRGYTEKKGFCALGSIKSNLGHTIAAAGVAGLLKVLLSMKYRMLPPSLHFEQGNPAIDFDNSPFYVNTKLQPWDSPLTARLAAVSSFGFSGTNAHLVIEEAPRRAQVIRGNQPFVVVLSANTFAQLQLQATRLADFCTNSAQGIDLANLSFTLALGRKAFPYRLAVVVQTCIELVEQLQGWLQSLTQTSVMANSEASSIFDRNITAEQIREVENLLSACHYSAPNATDLRILARSFVAGVNVRWDSLYNQTYTRISLPTYPFAKERYWVDEKPFTGAQKTKINTKSDTPLNGNYNHSLAVGKNGLSEDELLTGLQNGQLTVEDVLDALQ